MAPGRVDELAGLDLPDAGQRELAPRATPRRPSWPDFETTSRPKAALERPAGDVDRPDERRSAARRSARGRRGRGRRPLVGPRGVRTSFDSSGRNAPEDQRPGSGRHPRPCSRSQTRARSSLVISRRNRPRRRRGQSAATLPRAGLIPAAGLGRRAVRARRRGPRPGPRRPGRPRPGSGRRARTPGRAPAASWSGIATGDRPGRVGQAPEPGPAPRPPVQAASHRPSAENSARSTRPGTGMPAGVGQGDVERRRPGARPGGATGRRRRRAGRPCESRARRIGPRELPLEGDRPRREVEDDDPAPVVADDQPPAVVGEVEGRDPPRRARRAGRPAAPRASKVRSASARPRRAARRPRPARGAVGSGRVAAASRLIGSAEKARSLADDPAAPRPRGPTGRAASSETKLRPPGRKASAAIGSSCSGGP